MKRTFILSSLALICFLLGAIDYIAQPQMSPITIERIVSKGEPVRIEWETFSLSADSGVLMHDLTIRLSVLRREEAQQMPSGMANVTGLLTESFCLLPNGVHFAEPAIITVPYDIHRLPTGYNAEDIFTFYYDEELATWKQLERMGIDTVLHTVSSYSTHFTEFANAVIKVPEMPEAKAFVPTAMTDLPDVNPLQGIPMIAAPQANNRGTAELTYPIELPQGRRGLQPNIDLHYSSAGGNGILGIGWDINVPAITIDTRWGVPRYDASLETEAYLLNGEQILLHDGNGQALPLPHQTSEFMQRVRGTVRFYQRDTRNQEYITRIGFDAKSYYWCVTDRSGTKYYYGYDPFLKNIEETAILRDADNNIAEWSLTAVVDLFGNYITYSYEQNITHSEKYLSSISYTGNYDFSTDANLKSPYYKIDFDYKSRENTDNILNGRLGFLRTTDSLLCIIRTYAHDEILASYVMEYECGYHTLYKNRLNSVTKYDAQEVFDCGEDFGSTNAWHYFYKTQDATGIPNRLDSANSDSPYIDRSDYTYGSKTTFSYYDAMQTSLLFENYAKTLEIDNIGKTVNHNIGRGIATTFGLSGATTGGLTAGANFNLSYGNGSVRTMLMDMNGDGLPDFIEDRTDGVYYKKQRPDGTFDSTSVKVNGLSRLVLDHEISYNLGAQMEIGKIMSIANQSIGAGLSLNASPVAFSHNITAAYFADVNNDRLPDFIHNNKVYICQLDNQNNPYYTLQIGDTIDVYSSTCTKQVVRNGYVDGRLDCYNYLVPDTFISYVGSDYYYSFPMTSKAHDTANYFIPEPIHNSHYTTDNHERSSILNVADIDTNAVISNNRIYGNYPETILTEAENARVDQLKYLYSQYPEPEFKLEPQDSGIQVYRLVTECTEDTILPNVDVVRVWIAPDDGFILLNSEIRLINDSSFARQQSRDIDGVRYRIQHCYNVTSSAGHLSAQSNTLISDDSIHYTNNYPQSACTPNKIISVKSGDVIMFRLSAVNNRFFDDVVWESEIRYIDAAHPGNQYVYNSKEDFYCWAEGDFIAPTDGQATINLCVHDFSGNSNRNYYIDLYKRDSCNHVNNLLYSGVPASNDDSILRTTSVIQNERIWMEVHYPAGAEPQWSKIQILPTIQFVGAFRDTESDTVNYTIGSTIVNGPSHISIADYDMYKDLFGVLHKGWGQFAYNDVNYSDVILLDDLSNTYSEFAAEYDASPDDCRRNKRDKISRLKGTFDATYFDNQFTDLDAEDFCQEMKNEIADIDFLSDDRHWVPMQADLSTKRWLVVGGLGALGDSVQSTSLQGHDLSDQNVIDVDFSISSVPVAEDHTSVKSILKKTYSYSPAISLGAGLEMSTQDSMSLNIHVSGGYNKVMSDFMDLNGDGYPDFLGRNSIQYTLPWGGIDNLSTEKSSEENLYENIKRTTFSVGHGYSGSFVKVSQQPSGSTKRNRPYSFGYGSQPDYGFSRVDISYIDVNNDGLPDMVNAKDSTVRFNIGYGFTEAQHFLNDKLNISTSKNKNQLYNLVQNNRLGVADPRDLLGSFNASVAFSMDQSSIRGGVTASMSPNADTYRMIDVNGDGYLDEVFFNETTNQIEIRQNYYNNGYLNPVAESRTFSSSGTTYNFRVDGAYCVSFNVAFGDVAINPQMDILCLSLSFSDFDWIDMNADGFVDIVYRNSLTDATPRVLYNANGMRPVNMLRQVTNPTGQVLKFEYEKSAPSIHHAGSSWILKSVKDSLPHVQSLDESAELQMIFNYGTPIYDAYEKTDYGYSHVESIVINRHIADNNGAYRKTKQYYDNNSFITRGEVHREELTYGNNQPHIIKYHDIDYGGNICDDANSKREQETFITEYYDFTGNKITTKYELLFDSLYNLVERIDSGDILVHGDELAQQITYLQPDITTNLISLPISESIVDLASGEVRNSEMRYDIHGVPITIKQHDVSHIAQTDIQYDLMGCPARMMMPEDQHGTRSVLSYDYDTYTHTYPVQITNAFGEIQQTLYDLKFGTPLTVSDFGGNAIEYRYDPMGRLIDVVAPQEQQGGNPNAFTVHYDYHLAFHRLLDVSHHSVARDYRFPYVVKYQSTINTPSAGAECTLYNARGTEVQKKTHLLVGDSMKWVINSLTTFDCLGRMIRSTNPFVSSVAVGTYDSIHPNPQMTYYGYDPFDRKTDITHPDLTKQLFAYNFDTDANHILRFSQVTENENHASFQQLLSPQERVVQENNPEHQTTKYKYNNFGELISVTDADGYTTLYRYDKLGRLIKRNHPDAGNTFWTYDPAGNMISKKTANLLAAGSDSIAYNYLHGRLIEVRYPNHEDLNVDYTYDSNGHIITRSDATGWEKFSYDKLGNVNCSKRTIYIPTDSVGFSFDHLYSYDSFGRIESITYPDGDIAEYSYAPSGQLISLSHTYAGADSAIIRKIKYNEAGRKTYVQYGNNVVSTYDYSSERDWIEKIKTMAPAGALQNLSYQYDPTGTIIALEQGEAPVNSMGGEYEAYYSYNDLNQLTASDVLFGSFAHSFRVSLSPAGRIGTKYLYAPGTLMKSDLLYGYDKYKYTHQPRVIFDDISGGKQCLYWDANGNLAQVVNCKNDEVITNVWDEENRLRMYMSPKAFGFYGYDGNGERVYKLTGSVSSLSVNAAGPDYGLDIEHLTVYPSPYIVLSDKGYTKHFYVGAEKVATLLGDGGIFDNSYSINIEDKKRIAGAFAEQLSGITTGLNKMQLEIRDLTDKENQQLQYECGPYDEIDIRTRFTPNLFGDLLNNIGDDQPSSFPNDIYYTHSNHLGSASWITDKTGTPVQYIHYAPYGEFIANQRASGYDERFKFTGKERDAESGYNYHGARFLWGDAGFWLSVDPLADKYPGLTPYLYCNGNPIMLVDPDGRDTIDITFSKNDGEGSMMMRQGGDLQIVRIFGVDGSLYGEKSYVQGTFTIEGDIRNVLSTDNSNLSDMNELFIFLSKESESSNGSVVEWTFLQRGNNGRSYLGTSFMQYRSGAGARVRNNLPYVSFDRVSHNHPDGMLTFNFLGEDFPSGADIGEADNWGDRCTSFSLYNTGYGHRPYNRNSQPIVGHELPDLVVKP